MLEKTLFRMPPTQTFGLGESLNHLSTNDDVKVITGRVWNVCVCVCTLPRYGMVGESYCRKLIRSMEALKWSE